MEIDWLSLVGTRKTCVILDLQHVTTPDHLSFLQRAQEKVSFGSPFHSFYLREMTLLFQFLNYTRHHGLARCRDGLNSLFLF